MLIIGIAGGSGSGKTTVVKEISKSYENCDIVVLSQDSYYKDSSHLPLEKRQEINFDHPDSIEFDLLFKHIKELKEGKSIEQPIYSYITCTRSEETETIKPARVIIIEGILCFTHKELREIMDMKIFVDADADDRLARIIQRDTAERGRDVNKVLGRYEKTVKPMHLQFIEPTKRYADVIVPQGGHNKVAIDLISSKIHHHLSK
jgi:uridine kinase